MKKLVLIIITIAVTTILSSCDLFNSDEIIEQETPIVDDKIDVKEDDIQYPTSIDFEVPSFMSKVNIPQEAKDLILTREGLELLYYDSETVVLREDRNIYYVEKDKGYSKYKGVFGSSDQYYDFFVFEYYPEEKALSYYFNNTIYKHFLDTDTKEIMHIIEANTYDLVVHRNRVIEYEVGKFIEYYPDGTKHTYYIDDFFGQRDILSKELYFGAIDYSKTSSNVYIFNDNGLMYYQVFDKKIFSIDTEVNRLSYDDRVILGYEEEEEFAGLLIIDLVNNSYEYVPMTFIYDVVEFEVMYNMIRVEYNNDGTTFNEYYDYNFNVLDLSGYITSSYGEDLWGDDIDHRTEEFRKLTGEVYGYTDEYIYGFYKDTIIVETRTTHEKVDELSPQDSYSKLYFFENILYTSSGGVYNLDGTVIRLNTKDMTRINEDTIFYIDDSNKFDQASFIYNLKSGEEIPLEVYDHTAKDIVLIQDGFIAYSKDFGNSNNYPYVLEVFTYDGEHFGTYECYSDSIYTIWINEDGEIIVG